jgi:hypothetical protein
MSMAAVDFDAFVQKFPNNHGPGLLETVADIVGDEDMISFAKCADATLSPQQFLRGFKSNVLSIAKEELPPFKKALEDAAGSSLENVVCVDVGWGLTIQEALDVIVGRKLDGLYFGRHRNAYKSERIHCYMFDEVRTHSETAIDIFDCIELLELCFAANRPSARRYAFDANGHAVVTTERDAHYETMRGVIVDDVWRAVRDFSDDVAHFEECIDWDDFRIAVANNFICVVKTPTARERHMLGLIPHNREIGTESFSRIHDFWPLNPFAMDRSRPPSPRPALPQARPASTFLSVAARRFEQHRKTGGFGYAVSRGMKYIRNQVFQKGQE